MRKAGLSSEEEIYSAGNLIFKELRNSEYIKKLKGFMHQVYDDMYIIENKKID